MGDYGHFSSHHYGDFHCEGNIFTDFQIPQNMEITPKQHKVHDNRNMSDVSDGHVTVNQLIEKEKSISLFKPWGESLPNNQDFNSWLTSLAPQLINRKLVTMVIKSFTNDHFSTKNKQGLSSGEYMCTVYWYNNSNSD